MLNSRDSSIWRSLAVAFGDGVAFGVGVKLTQNVASHPEGQAPKLDLNPLAQRIREIEQKVDTLQQMPRAVTSAGAAFDQKVLEAVVNALDARLNEQAGQVERRLTELEARLAIEMKDLDHQGRSAASETESRFTGLQAAVQQELDTVRSELAAMRRSVGQELAVTHTRMDLLRQDVAALVRQAVEEQLAGQVAPLIAAEVAAQVAARMPAVEQALEGQISRGIGVQLRPIEQQLREEVRQTTGRAASLLASAADATVEEKVVPLRAELEQKSREIADLRGRVGESERSVLDVILSIGMMCRQAAEKITVGPGAPAPSAPRSEMAAPQPPDDAPPASCSEDAPASLEMPPPADPPAAANSDVPGFAQEGRPARLWRIPLVSSFMLATCGLLLLHYL